MGGCMRRRDVDPGLLEGEGLDRWYRRSFGEIEAEREASRLARHEAFFATPSQERSPDSGETGRANASGSGRDSTWQEARVVAPPSPTLRPGGVRIGVPPTTARVPNVTSAGGFFDGHKPIPNPALGPAYISDLPQPLNVVTPKVGGWFELGDGTLVKGADEVERIYAEQQRRMSGAGDPEPPARVDTADRFRDGVIPRADQLEKKQREKDATCHPNGGWERDPGFAKNRERGRRYETQITRAPGLDYVVRNDGERPVKFDGCAVWDPRRQLLEAKGPGYAKIIAWSRRKPHLTGFANESPSQARRQATAALGRTTEWHVAEPEAVPYFSNVLRPYPSLRVEQTPPR